MYIIPINYYRIHALALYASAAKIINHTATFVFIVGRNIGMGTFKTSWPPETREKRLYLFFLLGPDILCAVCGPPEILLSRRLFTIWKSRSIRAALRPDEQHTEYLPAPIPTRTYMLYFIHLFYYYIIILLYSTYNILSLRRIGVMGKVWRERGGTAGAVVFLYRRYLRSCKRFTIHFGALGVVVRPDNVLYLYCISITYHYYLYTYTVNEYFSRHPSNVHIYVCVCVCNTSQSVLFMLARKPPNNNITTVMRAVPSYIHISVLLHSVYYYTMTIFVWRQRRRIPLMPQPS